MNWHQVAANWPAAVRVISNRWPRTAETELEAIDGDRERFETHLSSTHDLTRAEAHEEVDNWLIGAVLTDVERSEDQYDANIAGGARHLPARQEDVSAEHGDFSDERVEERSAERSGRG